MQLFEWSKCWHRLGWNIPPCISFDTDWKRSLRWGKSWAPGCFLWTLVVHGCGRLHRCGLTAADFKGSNQPRVAHVCLTSRRAGKPQITAMNVTHLIPKYHFNGRSRLSGKYTSAGKTKWMGNRGEKLLSQHLRRSSFIFRFHFSINQNDITCNKFVAQHTYTATLKNRRTFHRAWRVWLALALFSWAH